MNREEAISKIDFGKIIENDSELELYKNLTSDILNYLENNRDASFNEIVQNVGGSDRRALRLMHQLAELKLISFKDSKFSLLGFRKNEINSKDALCPHCHGKISISDGFFKRIREGMENIYLKRPKPAFIFDQRPVNCETTVRRVSYLVWRRDIQGKKIAILGDDDLTSLAIGLSGLAREIVVFEVDKRLVEFIREKSAALGLNIKIVEQDLAKGIPAEYLNYFDVFMTDPTPTKIPFTVFANVGVSLLNKKQASVGYLSFLSSCMPKTLDIQKSLTEMSLLITDVIPFFTEYDFIMETYSPEDLALLGKYSEKGSAISFFEHLIRVETTKETQQLPIEYTAEDLLGKAAKRVLKPPQKDPALASDDPYIKNILEKISKK